MRFHRSELAFFVLMAAIVAACSLLYSSIGVVTPELETKIRPEFLPVLSYVRLKIYAAGGLMIIALIFGLFFIYPLIRRQANEEGKLRKMTESLSARSETLEHAALTDSLTGMQNRRYFDDALQEYLNEFRRIDKPVGLIIMDLDHFKKVNDTHGHDVGDDVLRSVAECLRNFTRYHDVVARVGGEEFAIVAPNLDINLLHKLGDRIRFAISKLVIESGNVSLRVTSSVGVALWDKRETAEELYKRADKMLYSAKRQGRNRVCA